MKIKKGIILIIFLIVNIIVNAKQDKYFYEYMQKYKKVIDIYVSSQLRYIDEKVLTKEYNDIRGFIITNLHDEGLTLWFILFHDLEDLNFYSTSLEKYIYKRDKKSNDFFKSKKLMDFWIKVIEHLLLSHRIVKSPYEFKNLIKESGISYEKIYHEVMFGEEVQVE